MTQRSHPLIGARFSMPTTTHRILISFLMAHAFGCADSQTPDPVGGETHFLKGCEGEGSCGLGLDCVCGVCTETCITDNSCKDQSSLATCEAAGTPNGACDNPLATPVCDVKCTLDSECKPLGATYTCELGSCRKVEAGACVHQGVIYANGKQVMLDCNACTCSDGTFSCDASACMDAGTDASMDANVDAQSGDAAVTFFTPSGFVATADPPCLGADDGGIGAFEPKPIDPTPVCDALDDITALTGAEVIVFSADGVQNVTQSDTEVFWTIGSSVYRVSKQGGTPQHFLTTFEARSMLLDGCGLYLADSSPRTSLVSLSVEDGSRWTLADLGGNSLALSEIVADRDAFYVWVGGALQRVPRAGGEILTMATRRAATDGFDGYATLVGSDADLYWIDNDPDTASPDEFIATMPKDGRSGPRVLGPRMPDPIQVHWRDGHLYALLGGNRDTLGNYTGGGGLIRIDPTTSAVLVISEFPDAIDVVSDAQYLYWTHSPALGRYSVSRAPLDGSALPTTIYAGLRGSGRGLMVDDTHLSWISECWGTGFGSTFIARVPKP